MLGLNHLTHAVRTLADGLLALSQTIAEANAGIRGRLGLDGDDGPAALPPASGPRVALPGPDPDDGPAGNGKVRRKARAD